MLVLSKLLPILLILATLFPGKMLEIAIAVILTGIGIIGYSKTAYPKKETMKWPTQKKYSRDGMKT